MKMKEKFKKLILLAMMLALAANAAHADLVAHWKLDETSGTIVNDSSGRGHNGVLQGGLSFEEHSDKGIMGNALHCDGLQGRNIFVESIYLPTSAFTIAMWFNPYSNLAGGSPKFYLMFWGGPAPSEGAKPMFEFGEDESGEIRLCVHLVGQKQHKLKTATTSWKASTWYQIAATFDGSNVKLYVNGVLEDKAYHPGGHYPSQNAYFGSRRSGEQVLKGKLDDIRIYNRALNEDEIIELYRSVQRPQELTAALEEVEALIDRKPKEAIPLIETRIAELQQWKKDPNKYAEPSKELALDLRFLLAKAKKAAGSPKKDVDEAYRLALKQGVPTLSSYASVVIWLFETGQTQEYERIARSLLQDNKDYLKETARKAETMVMEGKAGTAVKFLELGLATYKQWRQEQPNADVAAQASLPIIYFQLAKAKQASGASRKEIAQAYCDVFARSPFDWVTERAAALKWLLENECTTDYTRIMRSSMKDGDIKDSFRHAVGYVCRDFGAKDDWAAFERLLDALLAEETYPFEWVAFVESSILGNNAWTKALLDYCDTRPGLKFVKDYRLAEAYVADGEFKKAARLYQDIFDRWPPEDDRSLLEFEVYRCTFLTCEYPEALSRLKTYIADNKTTDANLIRDARLMIARCYMQLGQIDTALQELNTLTIEYPQTEQIPQARFLLGYCHMLQGKPKEATEVFEGVVQDYPESSWASKARLCLAQLRNMTDARTAKQD
ncbi:MAG: LamG-like jellyroll fold domain-containing protein [Planctomycetota bacterium]|jgi:TolA-binding protein